MDEKDSGGFGLFIIVVLCAVFLGFTCASYRGGAHHGRPAHGMVRR